MQSFQDGNWDNTSGPCGLICETNNFNRHRDSTLKPVLSDHSKMDKTKVLQTNGSLMKVESIAECSLGASCNTFDLH